jgi:FKBP-type peptidyl-prolyl cis-trans isomerase
MRIVKFAAVTAFSLVALSACDNKKPAGETAKTETAKGYTLSAADNARFLKDYGARPDVKKTADGLMYRVIKAGTGATAQGPADMVTVYYKGNTIDGKVFDKTEDGKPASFPAGQLIPGWVEALTMMKEGDAWELVIPSNLGYGPEGAGGAIGPNQTLVFEMTLLKVQHAQ